MDEGLDVPGVEQTGSGPVSIKDRRNLTKAHMRSLQLIGACELGRLARAQFVELRPDIPDITLKILVHGTGLAVPLGTLIRCRRQPVVRPTEEIFSQRQLQQRPPLQSARVASSRGKFGFGFRGPASSLFQKRPHLTPRVPAGPPPRGSTPGRAHEYPAGILR